MFVYTVVEIYSCGIGIQKQQYKLLENYKYDLGVRVPQFVYVGHQLVALRLIRSGVANTKPP